MSETKINVREITELRRTRDQMKIKITELERSGIRIKAEWVEDVEYWKG